MAQPIDIPRQTILSGTGSDQKISIPRCCKTYSLMPTIDPLVSPNEFVGLDGLIHLCSGGESPWLKRQAEVFQEFCQLKSSSDSNTDTC